MFRVRSHANVSYHVFELSERGFTSSPTNTAMAQEQYNKYYEEAKPHSWGVFDSMCHTSCHRCFLHMPRPMHKHKRDNPKTLHLNPKSSTLNHECEEATATLSDIGYGLKYK